MASYATLTSDLKDLLEANSFTPIVLAPIELQLRHDSQDKDWRSGGRYDFYTLNVALTEEIRVCNAIRQEFIITITRYLENKQGEDKILDLVGDVENVLEWLKNNETLGGNVDYFNYNSGQQISVSNVDIGNTRCLVASITLTAKTERV